MIDNSTFICETSHWTTVLICGLQLNPHFLACVCSDSYAELAISTSCLQWTHGCIDNCHCRTLRLRKT